MFLVYCLFLVPLAIQIVGWLAVGQYSLQISEHLLGTPPARPAGDLKRVLRRAIICLVASWIVLLLFSFMPTIQGWIATNAVVG